eukprot:768427-Hanusia_phi.AAC.5
MKYHPCYTTPTHSIGTVASLIAGYMGAGRYAAPLKRNISATLPSACPPSLLPSPPPPFSTLSVSQLSSCSLPPCALPPSWSGHGVLRCGVICRSICASRLQPTHAALLRGGKQEADHANHARRQGDREENPLPVRCAGGSTGNQQIPQHDTREQMALLCTTPVMGSAPFLKLKNTSTFLQSQQLPAG